MRLGDVDVGRLAQAVRGLQQLDTEDWPRHLTCDEADILANLFRAVGYHRTADNLIAAHAEADSADEGDRHI